MIPIGICTDFGNLPEAYEAGFDFMEIPLRDLAALPESDYREFVDYIEAADISIAACYDMLPDDLPITGPGVSAGLLHEYLSRAFARASRLGIKVISMDGAKSRAVAGDADFSFAWRQFGNFLRLVQGHANEANLAIAIEPIRKSECNLLNLVSEATLMASLLQLGNVGVLANMGSMAMASEPLSTLRRAAPVLQHVHIQGALRKGLPAENDGEDYAKTFRMLAEINYTGGVSIRSQAIGDFPSEAAAALECLKKARAAV